MPCFLEETFEDIKGEIRRCKLKNTIYTMAKKKNDKRTNHDVQNTTQKAKDRAKQIPLKPGVHLDFPEG